MSAPEAVDREAGREASPPGDGGWTVMAMIMSTIALVLPSAIAVITRKFALIFTDLGMRLPEATVLWLRPILHVAAAVALIVIALIAAKLRLAWVFGLAAFLYAAAT